MLMDGICAARRDEAQRDEWELSALHQTVRDFVDRAIAPDDANARTAIEIRRPRDLPGVPDRFRHSHIQFSLLGREDGLYLLQHRQSPPSTTARIDYDRKAFDGHV